MKLSQFKVWAQQRNQDFGHNICSVKPVEDRIDWNTQVGFFMMASIKKGGDCKVQKIRHRASGAEVPLHADMELNYSLVGIQRFILKNRCFEIVVLSCPDNYVSINLI
eukprot:4251140-Lingulodinium_polyedra.AAC.1